MKNQYVGDIGDYTKLGLLRVIEKAGFSTGVNWYLTPPDSGNDGKKAGYLSKTCDTPDIELFNALQGIRIIRSVEAIEASNLLTNARFYKEELSGVHRKSWHEKALTHLFSQDVVFLDPDNGFEVGGVNPNFLDGNKYVTYDEAADYFFKNNASVIVYQHWWIPPEKSNNYNSYIKSLQRIKEHLPEQKRTMARLFCIKASHRDYFFLLQSSHYEKITQAISVMLDTGWSKHLAFRKEIDDYVFNR